MKYTNKPGDRGGPTKAGITLSTLAHWRGRPCTAAEVEALTIIEIEEIYRFLYIREPGFDKIQSKELRVFVIDAGVQHDVRDATRMLQRALGLTGADVDGDCGPKTLALANSKPVPITLSRMLADRISYYGRLVQDDPQLKRALETFPRLQAQWAEGWANRMAPFIHSLGELTCA